MGWIIERAGQEAEVSRDGVCRESWAGGRSGQGQGV